MDVRRRKGKSYSFINESHGLCINKKDILFAELEACERLLKYTLDKAEEETVKKEITELKTTLET